MNAETPYKSAKEYLNAVKQKPGMKMGGTGTEQEDQDLPVAGDSVVDPAFRHVDARALVYSFSAIPAFFFLMAPVIERILGEEAVSQEAVESFADAVTVYRGFGLAAVSAFSIFFATASGPPPSFAIGPS